MYKAIPSRTGFEEGVSYRMVPCEQPPSAAETDADARAVEVLVMWGEHSVLAVEHVPLGRGFSVGEACDDHGKLQTDFLISASTLGAAQLPIVIDDGDGPSVVMAGGERCKLARGQTVQVAHGDFHFLVRETAAAKRLGVGGVPTLDVKQSRWTLASFAAHCFFVGLFYFLPPTSSALSIDLLQSDPRYSKYLTVPVTLPEPEPTLSPAKKDAADSGKAHASDAGQMGDRKAPNQRRKYAIAGPKDAHDVQLPQQTTKDMVASNSIIGVLQRQVGALAPSSIFGAKVAIGRDPESAIGALFGDRLGASFGFAGLGPVGTGIGGGGDARDSVGVGDVHTLGVGTGGRYGSSAGGLHDHRAIGPRIRVNPPEVVGALSKEVIRRTIGRHINEVRYCYSQALSGHPELQGRVAIKFVISPSGVVTLAVVASSDLGHRDTEECIRSVVQRMTFPQPQGGIVAVTYPFVLQQVGN